MLLSILVPTYNYACLSLCQELSRQVESADISAEIIVMDDASTDSAVCEENRKINSLPNCRLIELKGNIGIAKIRNRLASEAVGEYLLFLDSDVFPVSDKFVEEYVRHTDRSRVYCGGLTFRTDGPVPISPLRYAYGMRYEILQTHFISLNFFLSAELFRQVKFDETFSKYGHEDTLFGAELERLGVKVEKIDNPVYHDNGDTSQQFIEKTRVAIDNLVEHQDKLQETSRILRLYSKLRPLHIGWLLALPYRWCSSIMEKNLLSDRPALFVYNVYKLSYLCHCLQGKK